MNAHVDEIIVKDNKAIGVRVCKSSSLDTGKPSDEEKPQMTEIYAPVIINATGMHTLYNKLLPQDLPLVKEFKKSNKTIPSYGHNYLFVAIKGIFSFLTVFHTQKCFHIFTSWSWGIFSTLELLNFVIQPNIACE